MRTVIRPLTKTAVSPFDQYVIVIHLPNERMRAVESGYGMDHVNRMKKLFEEHDRENGLASDYEVIHKKEINWVSE